MFPPAPTREADLPTACQSRCLGSKHDESHSVTSAEASIYIKGRVGIEPTTLGLKGRI